MHIFILIIYMYIYVPYLVRQHKRPAIHYYTYILRDIAHLSRYEMIPSGQYNCFRENDIVPFQQLMAYITIPFIQIIL